MPYPYWPSSSYYLCRPCNQFIPRGLYCRHAYYAAPVVVAPTSTTARSSARPAPSPAREVVVINNRIERPSSCSASCFASCARCRRGRRRDCGYQCSLCWDELALAPRGRRDVYVYH